MNLDTTLAKIRKAETPFYRTLRRSIKTVIGLEMPYIKGVHDSLYQARKLNTLLTRTFARSMYHQPMFRSRCSSCGDNLYICNSGQGQPHVSGNVEIHIGDNVSMHDKTTIVGLTHGNDPSFRVGNNTGMSTPTSFFIGNEVSIGEYCLIGCALIADNPGHPLNYKERVSMPVEKHKIGKVIIGDYVWAALNSMIVGDVTIGAGAVIGANAVVTRDVPPFCLVVGNPSKIIKKLDFPEEMIPIVGDLQYQKYKEAKVG